MGRALVQSLSVHLLNSDRHNNDYTNSVFFGLLKEYSIVRNYLKEKIVIKINMSDEKRGRLISEGQINMAFGR